ncbi:MAG: aminodeoxychorismate synthase component I [Verrucomicrobiia bacterium]
MTPLVQEASTRHTPESLTEALLDQPGVVLLRSGLLQGDERYSFLAARPFLTFRSVGTRCEMATADGVRLLYGNPWAILEDLLARYELLEAQDTPFPLGGCFGYWGYDLKRFLEPCLPERSFNDLELPDCHLGFYGSLVVFDHRLDKTWIVSTGLDVQGARLEPTARESAVFWRDLLAQPASPCPPPLLTTALDPPCIRSTLTRAQFVAAVQRAQRYIRAGDIYQVNLAQRFSAEWPGSGWAFYRRLAERSPAPFEAYLDAGDFQLASTSPELFLRMSGRRIVTRPIKGTRPRAVDPVRDAQLAYELQTSSKELAELVMITDLLRNDLGKICDYGSVQAPELVRLERYAHVQHLVSTVEGRLRGGHTHLAALASCFPGGSITGAPKIRAMQIIDDLEPVTRGPYTGVLGCLGFNAESALSIVIRTAICRLGTVHFHAGAGIVADSNAEAEYEETLAKAGGYFDALQPANRPIGIEPGPWPREVDSLP